MNHGASAYGLWALVLINAAVFIIFAYSFVKPTTGRDWRSFGAFSAFIVALFAEMYGFPLTIYLLSVWLQSRYPGLDLFSHESGHLWHTMLGFKGDPHSDPLHILVVMYAKLTRREEREAHETFGETWDAYATRTPRFFPRLGASPAGITGAPRG